MNNTSEFVKRQSSKITLSQNQMIRQVASLLPLYQSCSRGRARPLCHQSCLVFFTPVDCSPHRHRFSFSSFNAWQNEFHFPSEKKLKEILFAIFENLSRKKYRKRRGKGWTNQDGKIIEYYSQRYNQSRSFDFTVSSHSLLGQINICGKEATWNSYAQGGTHSERIHSGEKLIT